MKCDRLDEVRRQKTDYGIKIEIDIKIRGQ